MKISTIAPELSVREAKRPMLRPPLPTSKSWSCPLRTLFKKRNNPLSLAAHVTLFTCSCNKCTKRRCPQEREALGYHLQLFGRSQLMWVVVAALPAVVADLSGPTGHHMGQSNFQSRRTAYSLTNIHRLLRADCRTYFQNNRLRSSPDRHVVCPEGNEALMEPLLAAFGAHRPQLPAEDRDSMGGRFRSMALAHCAQSPLAHQLPTLCWPPKRNDPLRGVE